MQDVYKHLRKFGLVSRGSVQKHLNSFTQKRLEKFIDVYLEVAKERPLARFASRHATDIYPDSYASQVPVGLIKHLGFYAHLTYVHDPLLKLALEYRNLHTVRYIVEFPSREERIQYFKSLLTKEIETLLYIQPLVEANLVHIAPTEFLYPPREADAIYADDLFGPDGSVGEIRATNPIGIPPGFDDFCDQQVMAAPARYSGNQSIIEEFGNLSPRRMIAVGFRGESEMYTFRFSDVKKGEETSPEALHLKMFFDPKDPLNPPVDEQSFWEWVAGSRRKVAIERLDRLVEDMMLADTAGAKFITTLKTSNDLVQMSLGLPNDRTQVKRLSAVLRMNLPFFDEIEMNSIAKARQNEAAFEDFRKALDKALDQIVEEPDAPDFQRRVDEVSDDLLRLPLAKIDREMKGFQRNLALGGAVSLGALVATIVNPPASVFVGAATLFANTYRQNKQQEEAIKQMPAYYYWKAIHT